MKKCAFCGRYYLGNICDCVISKCCGIWTSFTIMPLVKDTPKLDATKEVEEVLEKCKVRFNANNN